ncbi:MAG: ABC transporter permease [Lentisphaerae bacterium]|nr:ABC transporter permease [Lentisphaerota bacterium]
MKQTIKNIFFLGVKELRGLSRDWMLLALIAYAFTIGVYVSGNAAGDTISKAAIAVVDEDNSQASKRICDAFFPPMFLPAETITLNEIDPAMDEGKYTFVLVIPSGFEQDVKAGRDPDIQLNVDATRMSQAFTGSGYIQQIINRELAIYENKGVVPKAKVQTVVRNRYNANLTQKWFKGVMQLVSSITMLAIILTGSALIRERENGTLEHLLVMPVTPFEIMFSKIWSMLLVVLIATLVSLLVVIMQLLDTPVNGSIGLFTLGVALHLFAVTSLGIFLACIAQNMPQLGMLLILVLLPMQMLSGGSTPMESMPEWVQYVMQAAPTTHFVEFCQAILFRGAGMSVVWKPFAALFAIGAVLFAFSLSRFRKSVAQ